MKSTAKQNSQPSPVQPKPFFNKGEGGSFFSDSSEQKQSFFNASPIQASMTVGQPDDPYEQEAEKVSSQVVEGFDQASSIQRKLAGLGLQPFTIQPFTIGSRISRKLQKILSRTPLSVQAKCQNCEEEEKMQKKSEAIQFTGEGSSVSPVMENKIQSLRGGGQPMDNVTQTAMESSFGADFSNVRIHTNSLAVQMSKDLHAHAFTVGNDIFFNEGSYQPTTKQGAGLLAHELTHTVQQGASIQNKSVHRQPLLSSLANHAAAHNSLMNGGTPALNKKEIAQLQSMPGVGTQLQQSQIMQMKEVDKVQKKANVGIMRSCLGGGGGSSAACAPISMTKVVSGPFQGGFTMDSYYPDLAGRGIYATPGTAGPFNTGTSVGSNVQLIASVPSTCTTTPYTFGQTVKYTRFNMNGVAQPNVGVVQDDIAKSGRDFSRAPARQVWTAGAEQKISMADPPSIRYSATDNIEFDREFVTSLSDGSNVQRVNWSTSIRVVNGAVTTNTVT